MEHKNQFPHPVLDHWFFGRREELRNYNTAFMRWALKILKDQLKNKTKLKLNGLLDNERWVSTDLEKPETPWHSTRPNDSNYNLEDDNKELVTEYFKSITENWDCNLHAFTNLPSFDSHCCNTTNQFHLNPCTCQPCNNRDGELGWMTNENWNGMGECKPFEFVSHHPKSMDNKNILNNQFGIQDAHFFSRNDADAKLPPKNFDPFCLPQLMQGPLPQQRHAKWTEHREKKLWEITWAHLLTLKPLTSSSLL